MTNSNCLISHSSEKEAHKSNTLLRNCFEATAETSNETFNAILHLKHVIEVRYKKKKKTAGIFN